MPFTLSIKSVVQGYHVYIKKYGMHAKIGIELPCKRKFTNSHDPFMHCVKVLKDYLVE